MIKGARVAIMAGGTGGHVFPALAIADRLRASGCEVSWIGTARGIENRVVPDAGYPLNLISVTGVRGKGVKSLLLAPFQISRALWESRKILSTIKPHLVLGFGGFVAGPVGLAAKLRGDPLAIHEQNARAGTTNRILARWADRVMTGFPDSLERAVYVGNPVRRDICEVPPAQIKSNEPLNILVLGGSQGARALNQVLPAALQELAQKREINVRHQCGPRWLDDTRNLYTSLQLPVEVEAFIDQMSDAYSWSDLVICRSGAMTVAEVAAVGRPALFIPFPFAIDDHQTANAQWLVNQGGAELIQESEMTPDLLNQILARLVQPENLQQMASASRAAAITDSADRMLQICEELIHVD